MNKMLAIIVFLVFGLMIYLGFVVETYKPVVEQNQPGILPKKEVVNNNYELPTLSEQEITVTDSLIKDNISTSEDISERKSVEDMIKRVDDILTGKVEQDTISFNYTIKAPEITLPWAN